MSDNVNATYDLDHYVHVWLIPTCYSPVPPECLTWLDEQELAHARRLHRERDRRLYVESHGWLRRLLSDTVSRPPAVLRLEHPRGQKPVMRKTSLDDADVFFNLSHTHSCTAVALSRRCELGVDIERVRPLEELCQAEAMVLHKAEYDWLRALSQDDRALAFSRLWTAKEAYTKALGLGLLHPFDRLSVTLEDEDHCAITDWTGAAPVRFGNQYSLRIGADIVDHDSHYVLSVSTLDQRMPLVVHLVPPDKRMTDRLDDVERRFVEARP